MLLDTRQTYQIPAVAAAFNVWIDIHAPIGYVFRFITEERGLNRWWANRVSSEPRPGGKIHCVWEGDKEVSGEAIFRRFEPPNHIIIEWISHNGEPLKCDGEDHRGMRWPARNEFNLALLDGGATRVHLHDYGIAFDPRFDAVHDATGKGWTDTMGRLKKVVEHNYRQKMMARKQQIIAKQKEKKPE